MFVKIDRVSEVIEANVETATLAITEFKSHDDPDLDFTIVQINGIVGGKYWSMKVQLPTLDALTVAHEIWNCKDKNYVPTEKNIFSSTD